jgi:hypothetical protein
MLELEEKIDALYDLYTTVTLLMLVYIRPPQILWHRWGQMYSILKFVAGVISDWILF